MQMYVLSTWKSAESLDFGKSASVRHWSFCQDRLAQVLLRLLTRSVYFGCPGFHQCFLTHKSLLHVPCWKVLDQLSWDSEWVGLFLFWQGTDSVGKIPWDKQESQWNEFIDFSSNLLLRLPRISQWHLPLQSSSSCPSGNWYPQSRLLFLNKNYTGLVKYRADMRKVVKCPQPRISELKCQHIFWR